MHRSAGWKPLQRRIAKNAAILHSMNKLPNCGRSWGVNVRSDIQVYLGVLELVHSAAGGEGVKVLFRVLNRDCEGSELLVIP